MFRFGIKMYGKHYEFMVNSPYSAQSRHIITLHLLSLAIGKYLLCTKKHHSSIAVLALMPIQTIHS